MEYLRKGAQAASKLGNKILEVTIEPNMQPRDHILCIICTSRRGHSFSVPHVIFHSPRYLHPLSPATLDALPVAHCTSPI